MNNDVEMCKKLVNYKIPLRNSASKSTMESLITTTTTSAMVNNNNNADLDSTFKNSQETFRSPLLSCEYDEQDKILNASHINSSRQKNFGSNIQDKQQDQQSSLLDVDKHNIFDRKRKHESFAPSLNSNKKPMFFGRDSSYPQGLNDLIQPLFCKLCNASLNSIKTAVMHYESKTHDKKIRNWLSEYSIRTGEPIPKVKRFYKEGRTGSEAFHCEACDLQLTSLQHASQHYNGKKHRSVVARLSDPSGIGYYNSEGKWVRQSIKESTNIDSRFGIGNLFLKAPEIPEDTNSKLDKSSVQAPVVQQDPQKHCTLCNISVTSILQMELHLIGSRHKKKLKQLGSFNDLSTSSSSCSSPSESLKTEETLLECVQNAKYEANDISIYRTPSGNYYCSLCNKTAFDASIFQNHLNSKNHRKNIKNGHENKKVVTV